MAGRGRYREQVLPDEYRELFPATDDLQPEKRLMLAVLEDAFARFQRNLIVNDRHGRGQFEEVENWFMCEENHHLYSLETICITFDIDVGCLRKRLMAWKSSVTTRRCRSHGVHRVEKLEFLLHSRKHGGL